MIFTADWHVRGDVPRCREETEEEWFNHQKGVIQFIVDTANDRGEPLCIVGDLFHTPTVSQRIFNMVLTALVSLENGVYIMYGNHDMYKRTMDLGNTSYGALMTLHSAGIIYPMNKLVDFVPYGESEPVISEDYHNIVAMHVCCFNSEQEKPFGIEDAVIAPELLKKYPDYQIIITGDQHIPFLYKRADRRVLNCGCITKQTVSFKDTPLFIWSVLEKQTDDWSITQINLPEDSGVVTDSHIVESNDRKERLAAFVERLQSSDTINDNSTLDFIGRLRIDERRGSMTEQGKVVVDHFLDIESSKKGLT